MTPAHPNMGRQPIGSDEKARVSAGFDALRAELGSTTKPQRQTTAKSIGDLAAKIADRGSAA